MKTTFTLLLILALAIPAFASSDPILTSLEGGRMELNLSATSKLLSGPGVSSVSTSGVTMTRTDPFAVFANPASWQAVRDGATVGISIQPHLSINSLPGGAQSTLNSNVDGLLSGFSQSDGVRYPEMVGTIARDNNPISGLGVIIPWKEWRFGVGYTRPVAANATVIHNGLSQNIVQPGEIASESIEMGIEAVADMNLNINSNRYLLGAARTFGKWSVGLSVSRTDLSFSAGGGYDVTGDVEYGTEVHSFNDPGDDWHNSFRGTVDGSYDGAIHTMQTGFNYQLGIKPETAWVVGASATLNVGGELDGGMDVMIDEYLPLEISPTEGTSAFDIARLPDPVQLTRTHETHYIFGDKLSIEMPHSFSVGISKPNGLRPNLNLTAYAGQLAYSVEVTEKHAGDDEYSTTTYSRGIAPLGSAYLGISPGAFFIGAGAIYAKDTISGYSDENGEELTGGQAFIIPRLDLGMVIPLGDHVRAEVLMVALPEDLMRVGVSYEF